MTNELRFLLLFFLMIVAGHVVLPGAQKKAIMSRWTVSVEASIEICGSLCDMN
jgi:hypothetical protein